jgi:hypothetical protein
MKLKKINESLNKSEITEEDFAELLKNNCRKFIDCIKKSNDEYNLLFRKMKSSGDYILSNPKSSSSERIAYFSSTNYHNLLISNLESWKDWPVRNKSIVCSSYFRAYSHDRGRSDKSLYLVIPFDNVKIATGDKNDFWQCFQMLPNDVEFKMSKYSSPTERSLLPYWISKLVEELGGDEFELNTDWQKLKYFLDSSNVDLVVDKFFSVKGFQYDRNLTLTENINDLLDPVKNNFKIGDITETINLYKERNSELESWFEDECLMIKYDKNTIKKIKSLI